MVDEYADAVKKSNQNGVVVATGNIEVVLSVPVEVSGYGGVEITDTDIEEAAIETIQEGKAQVIKIRSPGSGE